jgi:flagellar protein FliL
LAHGGATPGGAPQRSQRQFCVSRPGCVRITQAEAVMATKNETQPEVEKPEAEGEEGAPAPAKSWLPFKISLKLMMIVGGALAVFGLAGGGAYYFFSGHSEAAVVSSKVKPPVFIDMPDVLVNLSNNGPNDRTQYLKVKIALELPDQEMMTQITPLMPRLLDTFQTYLRELRPTDLEGSAGLYRLKEELTRRVDAAIAPNRINAVLFKEIVIQ